MKQQLFTKLTLIAFVCVGLGMAPTTRADHGTDTYLDELEAAVDTRLTDGTELTRQQRGALTAASNLLKRHSKNALGDAKQLSVASKILEKAFPEDETFRGLESGALDAFLADANTAWANFQGEAETLGSGMPAAFTKLLDQASAELTTASNTDDLAENRAKALSKAIAKLTAASKLFLRSVKAPAGIEAKDITLTSRGGTHAVLYSDGSYTAGEETGTWSYTRTGAKTGAATLTPTGEGATPREVAMVFKSFTSGTFNDSGAKGTFDVTDPVPEQPAE
jgi:hypothetical protein